MSTLLCAATAAATRLTSGRLPEAAASYTLSEADVASKLLVPPGDWGGAWVGIRGK